MKILHSKILGQGEPLLIIHGLFGSADNWNTLGKKYAEYFEVHLIDLRNHGRSFHSDEMNYSIMVDDLTNYISHYSLKNNYAIGHSMGGKVLMSWATQHTADLKKIIIADIAPKTYPPHHQHIMKALLAVDFNTISNRNDVDEALKKYLKDPAIIQFILKNVYWKTDTQLAFRMNPQSLYNNYETLMDSELNGVYDHPTLFLKGEKSFYIQDEDEFIIKKYFPQATVETIKNAGHWLHAENPADFFQQTMKFLTE